MLLLGDVVVSPAHRILTATDRGVLRWQAERIPTDRVHHVEALLDPVPGDHITERVRLRVTHVQITRRVGKHVQYVLLRPVIVGQPRTERRELIPNRQPALLDRGEVVTAVVAICVY